MKCDDLIKRFASSLYNLLVNTSYIAERKIFERYWAKLWSMSCNRFKMPVSTRIHGKSVKVNFGYTYPVIARRYREFNAPLVELTYQTWKAKGKPIIIVDVGAAIGDTVLLLYANLPDAILKFVCVDGDEEFFSYLRQNVGHLSGGRLLNTLLSSNQEEISDLVHIHTGTASAQSKSMRTATTLTSIINEDVDMLKTDVDGFDGRVLVGASGLLKRCHPTVVFEWHPILCSQTGNNWVDHFEALVAAGYSRFLWFTKYGHFSHLMTGFRLPEVNALAEYCLEDISSDWHYDIVALHDSSSISVKNMSILQFAKNRPSRF